LLDQVRGCPAVCFVTFNYDTLMENALNALGIELKTLTDYVRPKYSLVKLHGSIDWQTWISKATTTLPNNGQPSDLELILGAPIVADDRPVFGMNDVPPPIAETEIHFHLPALAIPTASKKAFVCPDDHVSVLRERIPQVTKIAVVGWRATEHNFLEILAADLKNAVSVIAACGNTKAAEETLDRMKAAGIKGDFKAAPGGFSEFVMSRRIRDFLGD
jgi:hypothetical protein